MTWSDDYGHEGQPFELCGSDAPGSFDPEMFDELEAEQSAADYLTLPTAEVYEAMRSTRVMLSFAAANGGFHLARDLRSLLLQSVEGWPTDAPGKPAQQAYIDFINLASKPGTQTLANGTTRNGHWAEFYLMGTLCAHTVVLIIDNEFEASPFCQGELDGFEENYRRAQSFMLAAETDQSELEPEAETKAEAEAEAEAEEVRFPGSEFELLVVYEQGIFAGSDGAAQIDALRARFAAAGAARCSFFPAWFSCFGKDAIVNPEATTAVEELRPAWDSYAGQTNAQKADRQTRVDPPRVPLEFWPFGIVGQGGVREKRRSPQCRANVRGMRGHAPAIYPRGPRCRGTVRADGDGWRTRLLCVVQSPLESLGTRDAKLRRLVQCSAGAGAGTSKSEDGRSALCKILARCSWRLHNVNTKSVD
jgi:hypothetical protein